MESGEVVTEATAWQAKRRPEILELFREHMFGHSPGRPPSVSFEQLDRDDNALDGKAVRKQITVHFSADKSGPSMEILLYLPKQVHSPGTDVCGAELRRQSGHPRGPGHPLSRSWMRDGAPGVVDHRATREIARRGGQSLAGGDDPGPRLRPGHDLLRRHRPRLRRRLPERRPSAVLRARPDAAAADEWGSIAAWAWGLSRAMDYLETDPDVDAQHVAVLGHSRLGKTALWAGAEDTRFALVISNDSGCGGAALSRRCFGETVQRINTAFPHWFCGNFKQYNEHEDELPIDQHKLIALIAPRPVYVASAEEDRWADPRGEFLSAKQADPVYRLLGTAAGRTRRCLPWTSRSPARSATTSGAASTT